MQDFFKILLIVLIIAIVSLIAVIIVLNILHKNNIKKMYLEIEKLFEALVDKNNPDEFNFLKVYNAKYDYVFDTPAYKYYIKVVPNLANEEICVNNSVKWQLRKSFNDESMRFVENIEGLMRMDEENERNAKRLYIVYPNARTLLKYINECEMVFIHPDTDVYGTNIISYVALKENPGILKIKKEI